MLQPPYISPCPSCHPVRIFFNQSNQINWTFFTQLSKIVTRFRDRGGRLCFLTHPIIPLIIVARQNYFYQTFCLKKIFPEIWNKMHLPIWNFKVAPIYPPRVVGRSLIFASRDSFKHLSADLSIQGVFLEIFGWFYLFVKPSIHTGLDQTNFSKKKNLFFLYKIWMFREIVIYFEQQVPFSSQLVQH